MPAAAAAMLMAMSWFGRDRDYRAEYPVLILFSAIGMAIMVSAADLITLYVGLELQSLAAYVLATFQRDDARSAEAGLKYFVLGALASGILLYGISLLYGFTGTTLFGGVAEALGDGVSTGELFGLVFVLAGLAFKIAAVPFHMWTPDVYEGAPTPVTAFFASAPKVAAMALLVRVAVEAMGPATEAWRQIVIFAALASTVLGGVAAIGQKNIKRLLAYSSINNVGFALVGLAAAGVAGVASVLIYMAVYVVMTLGAFLVVLRMRDAEGRPVEAIAALSGLSRTRPWLALAMAIFMFSLAGIPPLFGFWPKFLVFDAAVAAGPHLARRGGDRDLGDRRLLLHHDRQADLFRRARPRLRRDPRAGRRRHDPRLRAGRLAARLSRHPLARRGLDQRRAGPVLIRAVAETGSTNDDVAALARDGAREGTWLRAERQTGGKGRQGRAWVSPPGNLHASTLVRLRRRDPPAPTLALVAAVALHEVVAIYAPGTQIKWPNDLLFDGAKLAGILLEREGEAVILGFGVNLAAHPDGLDRPATSLAALAGMAPDAADFLEILARNLSRWLARWRQEGLEVVLAAWRDAAHPPGTPLSTSEGEGLFDGLDETGALRLRLADGSLRTITAGDVFLL